MKPLPPGIHSNVVRDISLQILRKGKIVDRRMRGEMREELEKEGISMPKMFYNFPYGTSKEVSVLKQYEKDEEEELNDYFGEYIPPRNRITDVSSILFSMIRPLISRAIFLKAIENIIIISLSVLIRLFVPKFKSYTARKREQPPLTTEENRDWVLTLLIYPFIATVLSFFRYLIKEHSAKFVNRSGSKSAQTLRALLFNKLRNSSHAFLKTADSSVIAKITLFDFNTILKFIGNLPNLFSFPIIFILSISVMIYFVSFSAAVIFGVFIIAWLTLILITRKMADQNLRYRYYGSQRSSIVAEIINKLDDMKANHFEEQFTERIKYMRHLEDHYIFQVDKYRAYAQFVMSMLPLCSILLVIFIEIRRGSQMTVTTTFTIVSIIASMNKPLIRFVDVLDQYYMYINSKKAVNRLLFYIPDRPGFNLK